MYSTCFNIRLYRFLISLEKSFSLRIPRSGEALFWSSGFVRLDLTKLVRDLDFLQDVVRGGACRAVIVGQQPVSRDQADIFDREAEAFQHGRAGGGDTGRGGGKLSSCAAINAPMTTLTAVLGLSMALPMGIQKDEKEGLIRIASEAS